MTGRDGQSPKRPRRGKRPGKPNIRALAAMLVQQVVEQGRSLDGLFDDARVPGRDLPLLHALVYGVLRHFYSLRAEVNQALDRPLKARDTIVLHLLQVGILQLRHMRIPPHAAVGECVTATRALGKGWASGLVNQVLRNLAESPPDPGADTEARYDQPAWLLERLQAQYPDRWQALAADLKARAPMALRVNLSRTTRAAYLARLADAGLTATEGLDGATLVLSEPVPTEGLPGFEAGLVSVQDEGAQLAAALLDVPRQARVLDACAAPGGKGLHLVERHRLEFGPDATDDGLQLLALEISARRLALIKPEQQRLGLTFAVQQGDATQRDWWDGQPFDRILLDAPCSGTGTLRRHPDIRLLKGADDLATFQALQRTMLDNLWSCLASGGILLYCTCSILQEENDAVLQGFLAAHPEAQILPIDADWGTATEFGRQLLPRHQGPDGFYFARLQRR